MPSAATVVGNAAGSSGADDDAGAAAPPPSIFAIAFALEAAGARCGADDEMAAASGGDGSGGGGGGGGSVATGDGLRHRLAYLGLTTAALSQLSAEGFAMLTAAIRWSLGHRGHRGSSAWGGELGSWQHGSSNRTDHHVPELHELFTQQRARPSGARDLLLLLLLTHVLTYSRAHVLTYSRAYVLTCLRAYVLTYLTYLRACLLTCLPTYLLTSHSLAHLLTGARDICAARPSRTLDPVPCTLYPVHLRRQALAHPASAMPLRSLRRVPCHCDL